MDRNNHPKINYLNQQHFGMNEGRDRRTKCDLKETLDMVYTNDGDTIEDRAELVRHCKKCDSIRCQFMGYLYSILDNKYRQGK